MKTLILISIAAIIGHLIAVPVVNSIFLAELLLLVVLIVFGRPLYKDYKRRKEMREHLKGISKGYKSKSEPKTWRGKTQTEVVIEKQDFISNL